MPELPDVTVYLEALDRLRTQTILLWPNIDAGADHISKAIRVFRVNKRPDWLRTLTNLTPENYLKVLANAACAIGNSSSFVRDAGYFGTPIALVGNRQEGRETDLHVTRVSPVADSIYEAATSQLRVGRYAPSALYGDGFVSERIAQALTEIEPYVQKRLHYIHDFSEGAGDFARDGYETTVSKSSAGERARVPRADEICVSSD